MWGSGHHKQQADQRPLMEKHKPQFSKFTLKVSTIPGNWLTALIDAEPLCCSWLFCVEHWKEGRFMYSVALKIVLLSPSSPLIAQTFHQLKRHDEVESSVQLCYRSVCLLLSRAPVWAQSEEDRASWGIQSRHADDQHLPPRNKGNQ